MADVTYVRTWAGWVYVSFITDVFKGEILGWQASTSLHTDLALDALNMAIYQQKRTGADLSGLIHHSDRGVHVGTDVPVLPGTQTGSVHGKNQGARGTSRLEWMRAGERDNAMLE